MLSVVYTFIEKKLFGQKCDKFKCIEMVPLYCEYIEI